MRVKDEHKTIVIFRRFITGGDVIAVFPELPGTLNLNTCESYQHVGQHGACSTDISSVTKPASLLDDDVKALRAELESLGYNLQFATRFKRSHMLARRNAIEKGRA